AYEIGQLLMRENQVDARAGLRRLAVAVAQLAECVGHTASYVAKDDIHYLSVGLSNASRQDTYDPQRDRRLSGDRFEKITAVEVIKRGRFHCLGYGGTRALVEKRHLAEKLPRAQERQGLFPPVLGDAVHLHRAGRDDVQGISGIALKEERLTLLIL